MEPDPVDDAADAADDPADDPEDPSADVLDPREAARMRRRDHDAAAHDRDLMRPGMGKVFKQIDESIVRRAKPGPRHGRHGGGHST